MPYYAENGVWSSVFAVPCAVVDEHIRLCSPLSLKVLMVILRNGGEMGIDDLSKALGQSRADIQDALNYWIGYGVLRAAEENIDEGIHILSATAPAATSATITLKPPAEPNAVPPQPDNEGKARVVALSQTRRRLTTQEINEMADKDPAIGALLQETQQIFGKPLTPVATDLVAGLYSYYGMEPDLILMLTQYCVSMGKESVRYIEKVAASWLENGIDSHEKAEAEILRAMERGTLENKIKGIFGIYDRALVSSEKKYISAWAEELHMDLPLIQLAFERSVEMKGKLSFAYINGILANWHKKNITTPSGAMQEITRGQEKPGAGKPKGASYDMGELEDMITLGDFLK